MTTPSNDFWTTLLADIPPLLFYRESAAPSPEALQKKLLLIEDELDPLQTLQLKRFAESNNISLSTLLLAVHVRVLALQKPGQRIVTGVTVSSRKGEVTLPLVFDDAGSDESWSACLQRIAHLEKSILSGIDSFTSEPDKAGVRPLLLDTSFQFNPAVTKRGDKEQRSLLESRIHELWRSLLPGAEFSVDDGFFDAGGNSLLLVRLHEKLAAEWPGVFSVARLFSVVTIAAQARCIMEKLNRSSITRACKKMIKPK